MTIVNDATTVAELRVGQTALIANEARGNTPAFAQACTIEAVYRDAPGWVVEYRYSAATTSGAAVLHGTKYYHHGTDIIDIISIEEEEGTA